MTPPEWPAGVGREQFVRIAADAVHGTSTRCDSCRDRAELVIDALAPLIAKAVEEAEADAERLYKAILKFNRDDRCSAEWECLRCDALGAHEARLAQNKAGR